MKRFIPQPDQGFVSLLACIMISLLLLVITVSMVTLETLQLRKASDSEQSLRAYYTAEAGVEDAVSKILSGTVTTNQSCSSNVTYDAGGEAGWTCQQISFSGTPSGKLDEPDVAKTIDPGTGVSYSSIRLEWDQTTNAATYYNFPVGPSGLPNYATGITKSSPVELAIVQYPSGPFAAGNPALTLKNAVFVGGGSTTAVTYPGLATLGPIRSVCNPARANYRCSIVMNGFGTGNAYLFRIRPRYGASAYQMTFYSGSNATGSVVQVPDGTATIDVTAKAGNTYRRTISKLPLNNSASSRLNFVMYSDTNICKPFEVIDNTFPAPTGCTP